MTASLNPTTALDESYLELTTPQRGELVPSASSVDLEGGQGALHVLQVDEFRLRKIDEVPEWLQTPFVLTGYRAFFTLGLCVRSALRVHNELANFWTHAVAGVVMLAVAVDAFWNELWDAAFSDQLVMLLFYASAVCCMFFSSCYHLCGCHSESAHGKLYRLDLCGVTMLILGSYVPGLYYGFYCFPVPRNFYCSAIALLCAAAFVVPNIPKCAGPAYRPVRIAILAGIVAFCTVPIAHYAFVGQQKQVHTFLPRVFKMLLWYAAGFGFYLSRFPERWWPGRFDILFHSHQFWHVCVSIAAFLWSQTLLDIYAVKSATPCPLLQ